MVFFTDTGDAVDISNEVAIVVMAGRKIVVLKVNEVS